MDERICNHRLNARGGIRCAACGEFINLSRNNYRVIGLRVDPRWAQPDARPEPPECIYKHRHCMDADEWTCEDTATDERVSE